MSITALLWLIIHINEGKRYLGKKLLHWRTIPITTVGGIYLYWLQSSTTLAALAVTYILAVCICFTTVVYVMPL